jgi:hypothetical protein
MASPRIEEAKALVARLQEIFDTEDPKVLVTLNADHVPSGSRHGVVLVAPPTLRLPNFALVEATWELHVVAGPPTNYLAAWERIDSIVQVLIEAALNIDKAEPGMFQPNTGPALNAYTLTLNE